MWLFLGFIMTLVSAVFGFRRYRRQINYYYGRYLIKFKRISKRPETPSAVVDGANESCHTVCVCIYFKYI